MNTNSAPYSDRTWGETLQNYKKAHHSLPWQEGEFVPTKRETVYEKSRKERAFNPVTMTYRDEAKESNIQQRERAFAAVRLNNAKDKQLCFEQKFNIINHQSHLPKQYEDANMKTRMQEEVKRRAPDSRVKYNIISHMGKEEHYRAKMLPKEGEEFTLKRDMNITLENGLKPKSHQTREFDVLTNKYIENNTFREVEDLEVQRDELAKKYWKTHDYDILAVRYCDAQKQQKFEQDLREKERTHGNNQREKLPPSVKYSEGVVYDIISNEIRDGRAIQSVDDKRNKAVASKMGSKVEEQIRTRALEEDDRLEAMSFNRINADKFKEDRRYGFDPITNISFEGRLGVPPVALRQEERKPIWSRLHAGGGGASSGGTGVSKPRDLSGGDSSSNIPMNSGRRIIKPTGSTPRTRVGGGATNRDSRIATQNMSVTQKPDFVPSLTIPSEGMVNGKLNVA
ncbi:hypothetical protein TrST_g1959 [Triparma strigata]|uniref:Uncharacterized protein n=1 Tax=Triparma strigata TaxID=1606541 RepID=A0A9W7EHN7_9STRA|nr:hypothetical protein TrST_g1959 [Triparma strigata]